MNKIITISRQFGSGGHYIGEQVARKLGIPFYDKQLIEKISEETGFSKDFITQRSEYSPSASIFSYGLLGRDLSGSSLSDKIFAAQSKIIRKLAEEESFVIIGRCADYILNDVENVVNIFISADQNVRQERISKLYSKTSQEALALIREIDKKRKLHYEFYTDQKWGQISNYDLTLNSSRFGYNKCAELIASL